MLDVTLWVYSSVCVAVATIIILMFSLEKLYDWYYSDWEAQEGSYALITGCDSGFGKGAAHEFDSRGIHVFAACLTSQAVQTFEDDVTFKGTAFVMDITKKEDIEKITSVIWTQVGEKGLRFLFNNAGIGQAGPIDLLTEDELRKTSEVNLWAHINVTKAMLPMLKIARGRIINMTSVAGRISLPYASPYCISKFAFEAFSDALRHEMKPWGVSVHIIEPGIMRTDIYSQGQKQWQMIWDRQPQEVRDAYGEAFMQDRIKASKASTIDKIAGDPQTVIDMYVHAALSTRPRPRYLVGSSAYIFAYTIGLLPTAIGDLICERLMRGRVKPAGAVA